MRMVVMGFGLLVSSVVASAQQYISSIVAGGAPPPQVVVSAIRYPFAVATDLAGDVYFSDTSSVLKLDTSGVLSRVAGTLQYGYSGDGGLATRAQLNGPLGLAVDSAGAIYIADVSNNRIRKVSPSGIITTLAQLDQPNAIALDKSAALYVATGFTIRKVSPSGVIATVVSIGAGGTLPYAGPPIGVAVDATGAVYVATAPPYIGSPGDVWKVSANGASTRLARVTATGLAVDAGGNLFFADASNSQVWKVAPDGAMSVIAGKGAFPGNQLYHPRGVAVDTVGNVYIADSGYLQIQRLAPDGVITTLVGSGIPGYNGDSGPAANAYLDLPSSVALGPDGSLYIAESSINRIRKVSNDGVITTVAWNGSTCYNDGYGYLGAVVSSPLGPNSIAVDGRGNLYVADGAICKVSPDGVVNTIAEHIIVGVALDGGGNLYGFGAGYVFAVSNGSYKIVAGNGPPPACKSPFDCYPPPPVPPTNDGGPATSATFWPKGIALDAEGNLYITDITHKSVRKVSPDGVITTIAGSGGDGVAVDAAGNVYITDVSNGSVRMISPDGGIATIAENLNVPVGIAVDRAGNIYVTTLSEILMLQSPSTAVRTERSGM